MHGGQERVCIWREIHSGCVRLELQYRSDERRVLVGESIMLLTCPRAGFNVVETADRTVPLGLTSLVKRLMSERMGHNFGRMTHHLDKLGILYHHGMNDAKEAFIRREDSHATSQSVPLHEALA